MDGNPPTARNQPAPLNTTLDPDLHPSTEVNKISPAVDLSLDPREEMTDSLDLGTEVHSHVADHLIALLDQDQDNSLQSPSESRTVTTISTIKYYIVPVVAATPTLLGLVSVTNMLES